MPQAVLLTLSLFNSRSPHGERFPFWGIPASKDISILAPRGERLTSSSPRITATIFQFSFPAWGAINLRCCIDDLLPFSILVPRMGSDHGY